MGTYQEGTFHCDFSLDSFELHHSEPHQGWGKPAPGSNAEKKQHENVKLNNQNPHPERMNIPRIDTGIHWVDFDCLSSSS